jgi:hypothetical protein
MKILAIILNVVFALIGFLSIFLALTSFMIFDAPGSEYNPYLWGAFWSALALPLTCFLSVIVSLVMLIKYNNPKKVLWIFLLPCVVIGIFISCMVLIEVYCQGDFSCNGKFLQHENHAKYNGLYEHGKYITKI